MNFKDNQTERSVIIKQPKNSEDTVVPALNMKKEIDFNTVQESDFNGGANFNA